MKIKLAVCLLVLATACASVRDVGKPFSEENVTRVLKTLSSDAMMGRSALRPEIALATEFIEDEFARIGLQSMKGLEGFRQEFRKHRVRPVDVEVVINGTSIPKENLLIFSDQENISIAGDLPVIPISYDSSAADPVGNFFQEAYGHMQDSTSAILLVAPQLRDAFGRFKGYFTEHFSNDRRSDKIYVVGEGPVSSYSIRVRQEVKTFVMNNVVGVLPGKDRPDEVVLFSAHYDHIGILPAVNGDSIANGADDDASGTTAVIELARHFKQQNNNSRTLMFVAFTAEEIGGFGSQHFSRQLDPDQIVAMFNIEMIGKPSKWGRDAAFVTGYERSDLGAILDRNVEGTGFSFNPDPYPQQNLFYRSDNATLARLGVPAHTLSTDQIDVDPYYHTVDDEFETIDIQNIIATIRAIAVGSRSVVAGQDTPSRVDKEMVD